MTTFEMKVTSETTIETEGNFRIEPELMSGDLLPLHPELVCPGEHVIVRPQLA